MITIDRVGGSMVYNSAEFKGLSSDIKPIDDSIPNGSTLYEMNTQSVFMYDAENKKWIEQKEQEQ